MPVTSPASTADRQHRYDQRALASVIARHTQLTRSDLEGLILEMTRERGLVIEADSWKHHRSRTSFEADRLRDLELTALGYRPARVTSRGAREAIDLLARLLP